MAQKVIIIGAGVTGLCIGWRLQQAGYRVEIYDKGAVGRGASWAAAGMLAANMEAEPQEENLTALNLYAQTIWPRFVNELEAASGISLDYRAQGTIFAATDSDELAQLKHHYEFLRSKNLDAVWCNARDLKTREPFLSPQAKGGIFVQSDHAVDNRQLVIALQTAFINSGGKIYEHAAIDEIVIQNNQAVGVRAQGRTLAAAHIIIAAGAWSALLPGLPDHLKPLVRPLKGQMLALQMDAAQPLLRHVLWTPEVYAVPRSDGRLLVGATVEDKGFDDTLTAGGMLHLLRELWEILPGMEELPLIETWVGHRPTSRDDAPIFGPSGIASLSFATGHHRNGILLAPLSGMIMLKYTQHGNLLDYAADFSMDRFK